MGLREDIIKMAKAEAADIICFAPATRFERDDPIFSILPEVKTVICLAFRILRGVYRGIEEGTTYYQFPTMGLETMEETVMPIALLRVCNLIEASGAIALPQRRHYTVMAEADSTNPEAQNDAIFRGRTQEVQMRFEESAVLCGLGERGMNGIVLTDEFGPMVRYCFILTDAELEADPVKEAHLCDLCGACAAACPGHAIDPSIQQGYQACICGRACDMDCYAHLEEKGVLTKHFKTPFRRREKWQFSIKDFE